MSRNISNNNKKNSVLYSMSIKKLEQQFTDAVEGNRRMIQIDGLNRIIKARGLKGLSKANKKTKIDALTAVLLGPYQTLTENDKGVWVRRKVIIRSNPSTLKQFFNAIKKYDSTVLKPDGLLVNSYVLMFKDITSNKLNFTSLSADELFDFETFQERIEDQQSGDVPGSDQYAEDQYNLVLDVFVVISGRASAQADDKPFETSYFNVLNNENLTEDRLGECVMNTLLLILDKKEINIRNKKNRKEKAAIFNDTNLMKSNVLWFSTVLNSFDIKHRIVSDFFYFNKDVDINELPRQKHKINGRNVFLHKIEPEHIIIDTDGGYDKDVFYIIYNNDPNDPHICLVDPNKPLKDMHISFKRDIYNNEFKKISTIFNERKKALDVKIIKPVVIEQKYLYFDFETIIDYDDHDICKPYSLAFCVFNENELKQLDSFDKAKRKFKYKTPDDFAEDEKGVAEYLDYTFSDTGKIANKCYFVLGYDCIQVLYDFLCKQTKICFKFVSFNGALFDNFLLYRGLKKINQDCLGDPFYSKNMLLNFKIWGVSDMFDIRRHLVGTLDECCDGFGITSFKKKTFDHNKAQKLYNDGLLMETLKNDREIMEYNVYDVLSLALLSYRYGEALTKLNPTDEVAYFGVPHNKPTVGSYAYNAMDSYWKHKNIRLQNFHVPKKLLTIKNKQDEELEKAKKHNVEAVEKSERFINFFLDMKKYSTGGRVQLFNGEQYINEPMASPDVTSLYPYVMCVMPVWYPIGSITETSKYVQRKIGFYYCDVDQSPLKEKNLPLILCDKSEKVNNWNTDEILYDYLISTPVIKQLRRHGAKVIIKHGFYFEKQIKSCELFKPVLDVMNIKNGQDIKKLNKDPTYNKALRETAKLISNSISGKMIEGLHVNQIKEMNNLSAIKASANKKKFKIVDVQHDALLVTYDKEIKECMKNSKPIYIGNLIYDYSKIYMYDTIYSKIPYKDLIYTDTDSVKLTKKAFNVWREYAEKEIVPCWEEAKKYDSRYGTHTLYSPDSKVYGSFENEYDDFDNELDKNYFLQKKVYLSSDGSKFKMTYKGVGDNNVIVYTDDTNDEYVLVKNKKEYLTSSDNSYLVNIYAIADKLSFGDNRIKLFEMLYTDRRAKIMTQRFQRNVKKQDISNTVSIICSFKELKM